MADKPALNEIEKHLGEHFHDLIKQGKIRDGKFVEADIPHPENFIYVPYPERDFQLLIGKYPIGRKDVEDLKDVTMQFESFEGREFLSHMTHKKAKDICTQLGGFMLSPRIYLDFLKYIKENIDGANYVVGGDGSTVERSEVIKMYNFIINSSKERGNIEWLDAISKNKIIEYSKIIDGVLQSVETKEEYRDNIYVNLDDVIKNSDELGIPFNVNLNQGEFKILFANRPFPSACWFGGGDGRMLQICYTGNPSYEMSLSSVRLAKILK